MSNTTPFFKAFGPLLFGRPGRGVIKKLARLNSLQELYELFGHLIPERLLAASEAGANSRERVPLGRSAQSVSAKHRIQNREHAGAGSVNRGHLMGGKWISKSTIVGARIATFTDPNSAFQMIAKNKASMRAAGNCSGLQA